MDNYVGGNTIVHAPYTGGFVRISRWIKIWLRAWRSEPVVFVSPLPVRAARARLTVGRISYLRAAFTFGGGGGYRVVGRVGTRRISLEAAEVGVRNAWRPVMRGRLEPAGTGSRLVGRLGWPPLVKAFSALWLGIVGCVFLGSVVHAIAMAGSGDATGRTFLGCLAPLGFVLFFIGLTAGGEHAGRGQALYLRSWLADRLQTEDAGICGYQPWQQKTPG